MTKAEEKALEAFPHLYDFYYNDGIARSHTIDHNAHDRAIYRRGYEQAEKDNALTWEDIRDIVYSIYATNAIWREEKKEVPDMYTTEYYENILKRFNDMKSDKENK